MMDIARPLTTSFQRTFGGVAFPQVLGCVLPAADRAETTAWMAARRERLTAQVERHGALLLRGFPLRTAAHFDACVVAFGYECFAYKDSLSNAVRVNRTERVFTANEAPASFTIELHHEMAQTPLYPSKLLFFCEQAAERGGATPLCRSDELFTALSEQLPAFAQACEERGLKYSNVMPDVDDPSSGMGRSWRSTLSAETREAAELRLAQLGYSWVWLDDGSLRATTPVLPAVRTLASGRKSFFNQLIAAFKGWQDQRNDPAKAITFGDGSPLDRDAVETAIALSAQFTVDLPWQTGDLAIVDNYAVMHGRRTFSGKRSVLAALVKGEGPATE